MAAPRNETVARTTDVVIDKVAARLGNDGVSLADDFVTRVDQVLGLPLEITPTSPTSAVLNIGASVYTLPDGQRIAVMDDGQLPTLTSGTIDFNAASISTGGNASFTRPALTAGKRVKALVQYKIDENKLTVTFGSLATSIGAAGLPALLDDYAPVCLVELTTISTTLFGPIARTDLVKIAGSFRSNKGPSREVQDVTGSAKTVFTLASVTIPKNRTRLLVLQNGIVLDSGDDYTVTSDTVVTMANAVPVNGRVTFLVI